MIVNGCSERKYRYGTSLHCLFLETLPQLDPGDTRGTLVPLPCQDGWGHSPSPSEPAYPNATRAEGQELPGSSYLDKIFGPKAG